MAIFGQLLPGGLLLRFPLSILLEDFIHRYLAEGATKGGRRTCACAGACGVFLRLLPERIYSQGMLANEYHPPLRYLDVFQKIEASPVGGVIKQVTVV